jgi:predicted nucleic acid-binding protein
MRRWQDKWWAIPIGASQPGQFEDGGLYPVDGKVGAHALAVGAVLVTNDHAFRRIKKLKVEDWTL